MTANAIKIIKLCSTCVACPSAWTGTTDDDQEVYIRYRWGHLRISLSPKFAKGSVGTVIYSETIGTALDGFLDEQTLMETTSEVIDWSTLEGDI